MPNNPYTKKKGASKSYMKKVTFGEARSLATSIGGGGTGNSGSSGGGGGGGPQGPKGDQGNNGWCPEFGIYTNDQGECFLKLVGWIESKGNHPGKIGWFVGPGGLVQNASGAVNIRGEKGD